MVHTYVKKYILVRSGGAVYIHSHINTHTHTVKIRGGIYMHISIHIIGFRLIIIVIVKCHVWSISSPCTCTYESVGACCLWVYGLGLEI